MSFHTKNLTRAALLGLALTQPLTGQDRPLPPARITLPSDSLNIAVAEKKIDADSSRIELPEVVILGQDRAMRLVENKKNSSRELPRLLMPEFAPVSIWSRRDASRVVAGDARPAQTQRYWAGLTGGSHVSALADGGFWRQLARGEVRLAARMERSDGAFENSQLARAGLQARIKGPLQPNLTGEADIGYEHLEQGAHGALLPRLERSANTTSLRAAAEYRPAPDARANAALTVGNTSLNSDTSGAAWRHSDHFRLGLAGDYTRTWKHWRMTGAAAYERETLGSDRDSTDIRATRNEVRLEVQTTPFAGMRTTLGIGWQNCSADSGDLSRLAALAQVAWLPTPRWGITLAVTSGLTAINYTSRLQENPWLAHVLPLVSDDRPLAVQLKAETRPFQALAVHALAWYAQQASYSYWERNPESGLFNLRRVQDVRLSELQFGATGNITTTVRLQGSLSLNSDHLQHPGARGGDDRIPYRPDYLIRGRMEMPLPARVALEGEAELIGERRRGLELPGRLPEVFLLHARLSRAFGAHLHGHFSIRNLLNREYVIWEGYQEPGVQLFLGLRYSY